MLTQMTSSEADELDALVTNAANHFAIGAYDRGIEIMDGVRARITRGYMMLPTDADGETIRIGDLLYDTNGEPIEDWFFECDEYGWRVVAVEDGRVIPAHEASHKKPATVTDLLGSFNVQASRCDSQSELKELIERYETEIIKVVRKETQR